MRVVMQMEGDADLMQIAAAARVVGGLSRPLDRGDREGEQDGDDGDHDQQLDQREARSGSLSTTREMSGRSGPCFSTSRGNAFGATVGLSGGGRGNRNLVGLLPKRDGEGNGGPGREVVGRAAREVLQPRSSTSRIRSRINAFSNTRSRPVPGSECLPRSCPDEEDQSQESANHGLRIDLLVVILPDPMHLGTRFGQESRDTIDPV